MYEASGGLSKNSAELPSEKKIKITYIKNNAYIDEQKPMEIFKDCKKPIISC